MSRYILHVENWSYPAECGIKKDAKYACKSISAEDGAIIPTYPSGRTTTNVTS